MSNDRLFEKGDVARRRFLLGLGGGLGWLSAADLLGIPLLAQAVEKPYSRGVLTAPHLLPTAKRVIYLHMLGAFTQADTLDYKPTLEKLHGEELPESVRGTKRLSTMVAGQTSYPIVGPLTKFQPGGKSGLMISDFLPHTRAIADDLCVIHSMHTEHVNHEPASKFLHTGFQISGRPSTGAWLNYALGSVNQDLPAFVVMVSGQGKPNAAGVPADAATWASGFLPSQYQGVRFQPGENPVPYVENPKGITSDGRRAMLDAITGVSKVQHEVSNDPEILSKLSQYEMSYRMQSSVPEVADISKEPDHVLDLYGPEVKEPGSFARNCLLARRLAERDVRFSLVVQLGWDFHSNISLNAGPACKGIDQPAAGLVTDLKQRGMLEDTLVVFGTEFGRTSFAQGTLKSNFGRDHHGHAFSIWLAGGGIKGGLSYGETDDFSFNVVKDGVHVHDLNATILHTLGIDHKKLTYRSSGRDFRLTDVAGKVVTPILA